MKTISDLYTALIAAREAVHKINGRLLFESDYGTGNLTGKLYDDFNISYKTKNCEFGKDTMYDTFTVIDGNYIQVVDFLNSIRIHAEHELKHGRK